MGLLGNRYFILYCAKLSASNLGYTLYMITIPAYAFLISRSIVFTGIVLFIEYGIYSLTFLAGPLVDRAKDKRYIISASEIGIGITALVLGLSMLYVPGNTYFLLPLIAIIAILWNVAWTADHAVLPLIVGGRDISRGNGIISALGNGHIAAGLAIGGFLFAILQPFYSILLYSACLFFSGIIILAIPLRLEEKEEKPDPGLRLGWKYLVEEQKPMILFAVVIAVFSIFTNAPVIAVAYIYGASSPLAYSILFSMYYLGSMLSGLLLARRFPGKSLGKVLLLTYFLSGILLYVSILRTEPLEALIIIWAVLGFSYSIHTPLFSTYLQTLTSKSMLGRSASNLYTFRGVTSTAGTLLIPLVVQKLGLHQSFLAFGFIMAVTAVAVFVLLPQVRGISL